MKKLIFALLILTMVVSLTACGGAAAPTVAPTKAPAAPTAAPTKAPAAPTVAPTAVPPTAVPPTATPAAKPGLR